MHLRKDIPEHWCSEEFKDTVAPHKRDITVMKTSIFEVHIFALLLLRLFCFQLERFPVPVFNSRPAEMTLLPSSPPSTV